MLFLNFTSIWIDVYIPKTQSFPMEFNQEFLPWEMKRPGLNSTKANVHSKTSLMLNFKSWDTLQSIVSSPVYFLRNKEIEREKRKLKGQSWDSIKPSGLIVQFWFLQMTGLQGIRQCDGKNESSSLTQDRVILQPVLNRAVRQYKCSKKAWVLAVYLKHKFPERARLLSRATMASIIEMQPSPYMGHTQESLLMLWQKQNST